MPDDTIRISISALSKLLDSSSADSDLDFESTGVMDPPGLSEIAQAVLLEKCSAEDKIVCVALFLYNGNRNDYSVDAVYEGYSFRWKNYYDEDDALGWPLQPLNDEYKAAIHIDKEVNADGGFFGKLIRGWNPASNGGYWTDKDIIRPLSNDITALI